MEGNCLRCGNKKTLCARGLCYNCYAIVLKTEKETGHKWKPAGTVTPGALNIPAEQKMKSVVDLQLESIIKENKIKKIRLSFNIGISITDVTVTDIT